MINAVLNKKLFIVILFEDFQSSSSQL